MKSLSGKNVVVTGGSRGIGYEICKILLENEMNVLAVSRDMTKLQSAKSQLPDLHILQADVSCSDQVRNIAQWVETQWGDLDILVNNAGISPSSLEDYTTSSLLDLTEEAFGQTIKVNVLAPYIDSIDYILVMSVFPGFGGQSFILDTLETMKKLIDLRGDRDILIGVDGGVNLKTINMVYETGVDITIVGSGLYKASNIQNRFNELIETGIK